MGPIAARALKITADMTVIRCIGKPFGKEGGFGDVNPRDNKTQSFRNTIPKIKAPALNPK
jgi:predicted phosphoribosyltransferase